MNISQNVKNHSKTIFWAVLSLTLIVLLVYSFLGLGGVRTNQPDPRIQADMHEIQSTADIIFNQEKNYFNIDCNHKDIKAKCDDIKYRTEINPTVIKNPEGDKYCAHIPLVRENSYFCIDNSFIGKGMCDETNFSCYIPETFPENIAFQNYQSKEKTELIYNLIKVFILLVLSIFSLVMLYRKNKIVAVIVFLIGLFLAYALLTVVAA